jgi:hypothetical protein
MIVGYFVGEMTNLLVITTYVYVGFHEVEGLVPCGGLYLLIIHPLISMGAGGM